MELYCLYGNSAKEMWEKKKSLNHFHNKNNKWEEWGHAGILCKDIAYSTSCEEEVTLESFPLNEEHKNGVYPYRIQDWQTYHYIMGICSLSYKWKWRGLKSGLYKERTPVPNPGALADEAVKYKGCGYADGWWDFATAKNKAERSQNKKFTCTTLV